MGFLPVRKIGDSGEKTRISFKVCSLREMSRRAGSFAPDMREDMNLEGYEPEAEVETCPRLEVAERSVGFSAGAA